MRVKTVVNPSLGGKGKSETPTRASPANWTAIDDPTTPRYNYCCVRARLVQKTTRQALSAVNHSPETTYHYRYTRAVRVERDREFDFNYRTKTMIILILYMLNGAVGTKIVRRVQCIQNEMRPNATQLLYTIFFLVIIIIIIINRQVNVIFLFIRCFILQRIPSALYRLLDN